MCEERFQQRGTFSGQRKVCKTAENPSRRPSHSLVWSLPVAGSFARRSRFDGLISGFSTALRVWRSSSSRCNRPSKDEGDPALVLLDVIGEPVGGDAARHQRFPARPSKIHPNPAVDIGVKHAGLIILDGHAAVGDLERHRRLSHQVRDEMRLDSICLEYFDQW